MDGSNSNRRTVEARREGESSAKRQNVTMGMETLDCPICFEPLRPPIFQCAIGHAICTSCHGKLLNKDKCQACSITGSYNRCIVLEHILESIWVRCSNSIYGCITETRYHEREEHAKSCWRAPCFYPEAGCVFGGSIALLLNHLTAEHKWLSTEFEYGQRSTLQVQEGTQALHSKDSGPLFLVKFTPSPPFGNTVSVLCVDPHATGGGGAQVQVPC